jgi:hypothetical protein
MKIDCIAFCGLYFNVKLNSGFFLFQFEAVFIAIALQKNRLGQPVIVVLATPFCLLSSTAVEPVLA